MNTLNDVEITIEKIKKEQPNIPEEGLMRIKRNMIEKRHRSRIKKQFKKDIMLGFDFLKEREVTQEVRLYKYFYGDYYIGIGVLVDTKTTKISVVACMCTPEDTWKDYIARGLLGYRLKSIIEGNSGAQWYYITKAARTSTNKWTAAKNAIDELTDKGLEPYSDVPKFFSSRIQKYGINTVPAISIITTPVPYAKKSIDT